MSSVAILIIAHKEKISELEVISLTQCAKVLGDKPIYLICPNEMDVSMYQKIVPEIKIFYIDPVWQSNYFMFNKLKTDELLYSQFIKFKFVLFYELDAFVFKNDLDFWCNLDYDYIGPPWFTDYNLSPPQGKIWKVGNGGFSLRKTKSILNLIRSKKIAIAKRTILSRFIRNKDKTVKDFRQAIKTLLWNTNTIENCIKENKILYNEDMLICEYGALQEEFKIPSSEIAMKFGFDRCPEFLYRANNEELPFGCHAWFRTDELYGGNLSFWGPIISKFGYKLNK
jgi:hypothetical protein